MPGSCEDDLRDKPSAAAVCCKFHETRAVVIVTPIGWHAGQSRNIVELSNHLRIHHRDHVSSCSHPEDRLWLKGVRCIMHRAWVLQVT